MEPTTSYSFSINMDLPLVDADIEVRDALQAEGFGIISEIDIAEKLKEKLGIDHTPHVILGACNPKLAYRALQNNKDVALGLPCNVVLREDDDGMTTNVSALLPSVALEPFAGDIVEDVASSAENALSRVFDSLSSLS